MMTVDKIDPLDKRRCKVFLDGDFAFALYKGEIKKYCLEEGQEISEQIYSEIFEHIILKRVRERALYLLKFSPKTEGELRRKLRDGFYPGEAVDRAVAFLKEYHYLDDEEYTANYIEVYGRRESRVKIKGTLLRKGVDRELIDRLLDGQSPDEEQQIKKLLEKKHYTKDSSPEQVKKIIAFLMRRGYSYDVVRRTIGSLDEIFD